jgi:hypothetical protein
MIPNQGAAPRHTWVTHRGVRGAAKLYITAFFIDVLLHRVLKFVIFIQVGVPPYFFKT